jgi:hypothetical protein
VITVIPNNEGNEIDLHGAKSTAHAKPGSQHSKAAEKKVWKAEDYAT